MLGIVYCLRHVNIYDVSGDISECKYVIWTHQDGKDPTVVYCDGDDTVPDSVKTRNSVAR
jgi:hypothetical protein